MDLGFGTLPGGVSAGLVPKTTVSITDDDVPAVEVSFEHSSYSVAESDDTSTADKRENDGDGDGDPGAPHPERDGRRYP